MAHPTRKRKCPNCKAFFHLDHRNVKRQRYCSKPDCRKASKADAQRRWLQKPENHDHFKGPEHVERVRQWRLNHPGYWRRKAPEAAKRRDALQDDLTPQALENQTLEAVLENHTNDALQDSFFIQPAVFIGLISHLTGLALQDDIAETLRRLQQLGCDILADLSPQQGGFHHVQTPAVFGQTEAATQAVQLGRSTPGR